MGKLVYSDEYQGPRWTYGLRNRPIAIGTVPNEYIIGSQGRWPGFNFGTIQYPRRLTEREVNGFELTLVEQPRNVTAEVAGLSRDEAIEAIAGARRTLVDAVQVLENTVVGSFTNDLLRVSLLQTQAQVAWNNYLSTIAMLAETI